MAAEWGTAGEISCTAVHQSSFKNKRVNDMEMFMAEAACCSGGAMVIKSHFGSVERLRA